MRPRPDDSKLAVRAFGLNFPNPIGMAAGFDKSAEAPDALVPAEKTAAADAASAPDFEQIRREIELRAYYRYCERGCSSGGDVDDWLAAEREVLVEQTGNGGE